jgi:hypothetical protein
VDNGYCLFVLRSPSAHILLCGFKLIVRAVIAAPVAFALEMSSQPATNSILPPSTKKRRLESPEDASNALPHHPTTPPRPLSVPIQATPTKFRNTHQNSSGYESGTLDDGRASLLTDYPSVHESPIDEMLEAFLPKISDCSMKDLLQNIEREEVWCIVPESPARETGNELTVFNFLADLNDKVMEEYGKLVPGIKTTTRLRIHGSKTPETDRRNSSRPDGSWLLGDNNSVDTYIVNYLCMVGAFEFKKKEKGGTELDVSMPLPAFRTFSFILWAEFLQDSLDDASYHAE